MNVRTAKHDGRVDLSYELPHRIRCCAVYPLRAPNNSCIILYGYDKGLRVIWSGGSRVKSRVSPQQTPSSAVIVLDDSDDGAAVQAERDDRYEEREEEHNGSENEGEYIVHDITIPWSSAVSRIAVPVLSAHWPAIAQNQSLQDATVSLATIEGDVYLLRIPLLPTATLADPQVQSIAAGAVLLGHEDHFVRDLSIRHVGQARTQLCIAVASDRLHLWSVDSNAPTSDLQQLIIKMDNTPTAVAFHPSSRSPLLLVTDSSSVCRTFEPPQDWTAAIDINEPTAQGRWTAELHSPYNTPTDRTSPARKRILDAQWLLSGRCILILLDDGEWGIWDTNMSPTGTKAFEDFVISGYVDSSLDSDTSTQTSGNRSGLLAPMTPNTRKTKNTTLFASSVPKRSVAAARGGITVSRQAASTSSIDESVIIWYGNEVYTIPSTQAFWQRSMNTTSTGFGTLSAPGVARVQSLNFFHECITSVSQLPAASRGLMKTDKAPDFVLSAESRFIIAKQQTASNDDRFKFKPVGFSDDQDQRMLDAGELDLGGMDRILDTMDTKQRRVGFAQ